MRSLKWTSVAAVVAASLVVSSCGGDDNSLPATPVTTPDIGTVADGSTESLISQGDGICAETNTAVGAIQVSETDAATKLSQTADLYDGMVTQLGDLTGAADDADLQSVLTAGADLVQAEKNAELAAQRGDDPTQAQADADSAFSAFASAAQSYGFSECGQDPTPPSASTGNTDSTTPVPVTPGDVPVVPVEPAPVAPTEPAPVEPAPVVPVTPDGGTGGGAGAPPVAPSGGGGSGGSSGGSSGGVGPG